MNCTRHTLSESLALTEISGICAGNYAVYSYLNGLLGVFRIDESFALRVAGYSADLLTIVQVRERGPSVIGRKGKLLPRGYCSFRNGKAVAEEAGVYLLVDARGSLAEISCITEEIICIQEDFASATCHQAEDGRAVSAF